jgi:hypothetical protein
MILNSRPSGKLMTFAAWGKFDGALVKLQVGFVGNDNVTEWMDVGDPAGHTTAGLTNVAVKGNYYRLVVQDGKGDMKINWWFG